MRASGGSMGVPVLLNCLWIVRLGESLGFSDLGNPILVFVSDPGERPFEDGTTVGVEDGGDTHFDLGKGDDAQVETRGRNGTSPGHHRRRWTGPCGELSNDVGVE